MLIEMQAIAHGRVQGIGFRATTKHIADKLHLVGYVRNLPEGTVEIVAQGERQSLEQFLSQLYTHFAVHIEHSYHTIKSSYSDFHIQKS